MSLTSRKPLVAVLIAVVAVAVAVASVVLPRVSQSRQIGNAQDLMQRHRYEAALQLLDQEFADPVSNADIALLKGRCCRHIGLKERFTVTIARAEELGAPLVRVARERTLFRVQYGDLPDAGRQFADQILTGGDDLPEICEAFATGFLVTGRATEALGVLNAWSADFPGNAQASLLMGESYHQLQDPQRASEMFRRAVELDPTRWELQLACGQGLIELMDYESACEYFSTALTLLTEEPPVSQPQKALVDAVNGWTRCLVATGSAEAALEVFDNYPVVAGTTDALLTRGRIALLNKDAETAIQLLKEAASKREWDTEIRSTLANALNTGGKQDEAAIHFGYLAEAASALRQMELDLTAVRDDPQNADLRYRIAETMLQYSDPVEARTWLLSCLAIDPDHRAARLLLADLQRRQQESDEL